MILYILYFILYIMHITYIFYIFIYVYYTFCPEGEPPFQLVSPTPIRELSIKCPKTKIGGDVVAHRSLW